MPTAKFPRSVPEKDPFLWSEAYQSWGLSYPWGCDEIPSSFLLDYSWEAGKQTSFKVVVFSAEQGVAAWLDCRPILDWLKVSKFQKEFMKSWFLPEYEPNIVRISALYCARLKGRNPYNFRFIFWKNDDFINSFWNLLTFSKYLLLVGWRIYSLKIKVFWPPFIANT